MVYYNQPYINTYQPQAINPALANQQQRLIDLQNQQQMFQQQMYQQPMQQVQQPQGLNGRIVDDVSTVSPNEVGMDGSIAVFPKRDMTEVYLKQYQPDGLIKTVKYVPAGEDGCNPTDEPQKDVLGAYTQATEALMKRFDELEQKIDSIGKKSTPSRTKKESEE